MTRLRPQWIVFALVLAGCDAAGTAVEVDTRVPLPDPEHGLAAFQQACAGCHASTDAFDLAFFGFSDTTIIRRAVAHVDTATARDIAAYVRTLGAPGAARDARLFQPGGRVLESDVAFARTLFGGDEWPAHLTTERLRAIDPLEVPVAIPLPVWSVEGANTDWLPDRPLPGELLYANGGQARRAIDAYHAAPTVEALAEVVRVLESTERTAGERICDLNPNVERARFVACLDLRRWMSALIAQHMLRTGLDRPLGYGLHGVWWAVGDVFRKSAQPLGDADDLNQAAWIYLGWMFEPGHQTIGYTLPGFVRLGLSRHATFLALRAAVARPTGTAHPYVDVAAAADVAPAHWAYAATRFGFEHLLDRSRSGDLPAAGELERAHNHVAAALRNVSRKVSRDENNQLAELARRLLAELPQVPASR